MSCIARPEITEERIRQIQEVIERNPGWHRTKISQQICKLWGWQSPNGQLKDIACRDMLRELDKADKIRLPARLTYSRTKGGADKVKRLKHDATPISTKLAKNEYDYEPPSKYYKDGFNLYLRMAGYRSAHLLFLHDRRVPYSNSLSERLLRIYKRKQHQVMAFRSFDSLDDLCNALGVIATLRTHGKNLYESVAAIFDMPEIIDVNTVD